VCVCARARAHARAIGCVEGGRGSAGSRDRNTTNYPVEAARAKEAGQKMERISAGGE
jgi:hypothetical protein